MRQLDYVIAALQLLPRLLCNKTVPETTTKASIITAALTPWTTLTITTAPTTISATPETNTTTRKTTMWGKKTALFYFCNIFNKPIAILIILGNTYTTINLLSPVYFTFFIKSKTGNQLKFQQYSALAYCSHTVLSCFVARCRTVSYTHLTLPTKRIV